MNHPFRYFLNFWNLYFKEITEGFDLSSRHSLSVQTVYSVLSHSLLPAIFTFLFSSIFDMQGFIATGCDFSSHIFFNHTEICQVFPLSLAGMWSPPAPHPTFGAPLRNFTHWCPLSSWKFFVFFFSSGLIASDIACQHHVCVYGTYFGKFELDLTSIVTCVNASLIGRL